MRRWLIAALTLGSVMTAAATAARGWWHLTARCDGVETRVGNDLRCMNPKDSFRDCQDCPEMVVVPAGSFVMGSPENEPERETSEGPQHTVRIGEPFAVGRFAVTRAEFAAFVADTGHKTEGGCHASTGSEWKPQPSLSWRSPGIVQNDGHPVVCVNWEDAKAFAEWISRKTGKLYRLLSEAEREYVARAGTTTPYWWGSTISTSEANYDSTRSYGGATERGFWRKTTVPIRSFRPNPWGLYNVHGNVWEWVEDCWHDSYRGAPIDGSAWTAGDCVRRVLRGGSWVDGPGRLRAASRFRYRPDYRDFDGGFRLARTFILELASLPRGVTGSRPLVGTIDR